MSGDDSKHDMSASRHVRQIRRAENDSPLIGNNFKQLEQMIDTFRCLAATWLSHVSYTIVEVVQEVGNPLNIEPDQARSCEPQDPL